MPNKRYRMNGEEMDFPDPSATLSDFLGDLGSALRESDHVVASFKIDGKEISDDEETKLKDKPIAELGNIEVFTSSPLELAHETLSTLDQYVLRVGATLVKSAEAYKAKNYLAADAYFVRAVDSLDLFIQTIGGIKLALRVGLHAKIAVTEASLVSIMNDLLGAKRQNNYVFLAELLEKDLVENLDEWRNDVFPVLRNWKTA